MSDATIDVKIRGESAQLTLDKLYSSLNKADTAVDKLEQGFKDQQAAAKQLQDTYNKTSQSLSNIDKNTSKLANSLNKVEGKARETNKALNALGRASHAVSNIWRVILGYQIAKNFIGISISALKTAESVELIDKKLKALTNDAQALDKVVVSANKVGISFEAMSNTVGRFAVSTRGAFDVTEMTSWVEGLVKSGKAVGSTTKELQSGVLQISQALSSGKLAGDELRSITESMPLLTVELLKVFEGTEHSTLSIKQLGSEGLLTVDKLIEGFQNLEEEMRDIPGVTDTIESQLTRLGNSWTLFLNALLGDQTTVFGKMLQGLSLFLNDWTEQLNLLNDIGYQIDLKKLEIDLLIQNTSSYSKAAIWGDYEEKLQLLKDELAILVKKKATQDEYNAKLAEARKLQQEAAASNAANKAWQNQNNLLEDAIEKTDKFTKINNEADESLDKIFDSLNDNTGQVIDYGKAAKAIESIEKNRAEALEKLSKSQGTLNKDQKAAIKIQESLASSGDTHVKNILEANKQRKLGNISQKEHLEYIIQEAALTKAAVQHKAEQNAQLREEDKLRKQSIKAADEYNELLIEIADKYGPSSDAVNDFNYSLGELNVGLIGGAISLEEYNNALFRIKETYILVQAEADDFAANFGVTTAQAVRDFIKLSNDMGKNLNAGLRDAFSGVDDAFESMLERMKRTFTDAIADMVYYALLNPIIVQVQQSVVGAGFNAIAGSNPALQTGNVLQGGTSLLSKGASLLGLGSSTPSAIPLANSSFQSLAGATGGIQSLSGMAATPVATGTTTALSGILSTVGSALPYIGIAIGIASMLGAFDGNSDVTPDMSIATGSSNRDSNLKWMDTNEAGTDLSFTAQSRYGNIDVMTQHGAFGSENDATAFYEATKEKLNVLDEVIFQSVDEGTNAAIEKVMGRNWDTFLKFEEGGDLESTLEKRFDRIFDAMNNPMEKFYEELRDSGKAYDEAAGIVTSLKIAADGMNFSLGLAEEMFYALDESVENVIVNMGLIQSSMQAFADYVATDLPTAFEEYQKQQDMTLYGSWQENISMLQESAANFDYSVESLNEISSLVTSTREKELALLYQIDAMSKSSTDQFESISREWTMGDMSDSEQFNFLKDETLDAYMNMMTASSPEMAEMWRNLIFDNIPDMKNLFEGSEELQADKNLQLFTTEDWIEWLGLGDKGYQTMLGGFATDVEKSSEAIAAAITDTFDIQGFTNSIEIQREAAIEAKAASEKMMNAAIAMEISANKDLDVNTNVVVSDTRTVANTEIGWG